MAHYNELLRDQRGRAVPTVIVLLFALAAAAGNLFLVATTVRDLSGAVDLVGFSPTVILAYQFAGPALLCAVVAPLVIAAIAMLLFSQPAAPPAAAAPAVGKAPAVVPSARIGALRLLNLLQQEGRFIDFVEEDIDGYRDEQVGAAVRAIHSGCRKALHDRMQIARIYAEEDGSVVTVPAGFDVHTVRLTGNVHGQPPFRGVLQHGGWRARNVHIPEPVEALDLSILAPAEVEIE